MEKFNSFVENILEAKTNPTITILVGPPASGKSTWKAENAKNAITISRDDIVDELRKGTGMTYAETFSNKEFQSKVNMELENHINKTMNSRKDIVVDMTNMTVSSRKKILSKVPFGYTKNVVVFKTSRAEILKRLEKREKETGKHVGINIVDDMINKYEEPTKEEGFDNIKYIK
jgi:predicted kinase